ncbi:DUF4291 domain-containing protein [Kutzneria sp. CA-103260]|uniref:DUF4291 domain-containing protein n=1 Tax=Kutzneria sp. CA-103260 TaxID=2802641 RepID=UPI001BA5EE80|nr:DUF4291 domain-containing protein [Kutzneria sp. CA-103260]QUQ69213.1 hypothetical protein JJ691_69680 [Kutzneria sp. CA-103260]
MSEKTINAAYDERLITVYQAYHPAIAEAALAAGAFVPPFSRTRMTWIKPSFRWMMHRSSWATAPGQERVLAIRISRAGFDWAVANACLSAYDATVHTSHEQWRRQLKGSPVRVQWDPDRDVRMQTLPYRAIQIGLKGVALERYVDEWTHDITDVTASAHEVRDPVRAGQVDRAERLRPKERPSV